MITEADIFQLFWSWNSSQSPYVEREWRHALSLRRETFIRPTYWEDPWPGPPEPLRPIQFQRLEIVRRPERHSPEPRFDDEMLRQKGKEERLHAERRERDEKERLEAKRLQREEKNRLEAERRVREEKERLKTERREAER